MKILFVLFLICQHFPSYSHEFIAKYESNIGNNDGVFIFIPRENGFILVENCLFKQFEYPLHSRHYESYHDFLYDVMNNKSFILYFNWKVSTIRNYGKRTKRGQEALLKKYLYCDDSGRFRFKRNVSTRKRLGIMKIMFDKGYYVNKMDYQAYWFFYSTLSPNLEKIPPEDKVVLEQ